MLKRLIHLMKMGLFKKAEWDEQGELTLYNQDNEPWGSTEFKPGSYTKLSWERLELDLEKDMTAPFTLTL